MTQRQFTITMMTTMTTTNSCSLFAFILLLPLVSSLAIPRQSTYTCDQYGATTQYPYTLANDLWGKGSGSSSNWQCSTLDSVNGDTVAWHTSYEWDGNNGIKSFAHIQRDAGVNQMLSAITSIPSSWNWQQSNTGIKADVAYDLFTSSTAGGSAEYELMVWLANFNSGPISYNYDANGNGIPVATNLDIDGHTWDLYEGSNGSNKVLSFLLVSGYATSFNGDMYSFFKYLINNGYLDSSQYLNTVQSGTEVTYGSATFETSSYSLVIN